MAIEKIVNNNHSPTEHMLGFRKKKKGFYSRQLFFYEKKSIREKQIMKNIYQ